MKKQLFLYSLRAFSLTVLILAILFPLQTSAQETAKSNPLKKSDLVKALESNAIPSADLIERIKNRGVDFSLDEKNTAELRDAGAGDEIIKAVGENYAAPKKKGVFGKFGGGLNKAAKIVVKTAPIAAEQLPQVQAAKAVVNAAKTASAEVDKANEAKETKPVENTEAPTKEVPEAADANPKTAQPNNGKPQKTLPAKPTGGNSSGLKVGEYACTGSGGQMMIGLGFKVTSGNRYTDLDGKSTGTFSISGGKIEFRGGHMDGITGRDLKDNWFVVGSQASCGPFN